MKKEIVEKLRFRDGNSISYVLGTEEYLERIEYELSVIDKMGYSEYFLIVQDYVNFAKRSGISVGPGRGSGAGSLVAYLLGITAFHINKENSVVMRCIHVCKFVNVTRISITRTESKDSAEINTKSPFPVR